MADALLDAFRHHAWATRRLIDACEGLAEEELSASLPGGYGSPLATLKHILGAEAFYRSLFSGSFPDWDWRDDGVEPAAKLAGWADDMASFWEELLSGTFDADRVLSQTRSDGSARRLRSGVMLAQALHHGNVHREQVSAVITSLGQEPPDLSAWAYGRAVGAIVP